MLSLLKNNIEWITLVPFGWQERKNSPEIHLNTTADYYWCETDTGIAQVATPVKSYGMHIMLKPHIWKWYDNHERQGGNDDTDFTPQNKAGENVVGRGFAIDGSLAFEL